MKRSAPYRSRELHHLKVRDVVIWGNEAGAMRKDPQLPVRYQVGLPPMEPILPTYSSTPRSIRLRSARDKRSPKKAEAEVPTLRNSPRRPQTARRTLSASRGHCGPLIQLNGLRMDHVFQCLWPPEQPSAYSPKGYYLRFSVSSERVLLEVVDLFTAKSFVMIDNWTVINVPSDKREKYVKLLGETFNDPAVLQSSVSITKHFEDRTDDMLIRVAISIDEWSSTHMLLPSEDYAVDLTQYTCTSSQHVVALLVAAVSDSVEARAVHRQEVAVLQAKLSIIQQTYDTLIKQHETTKEELKGLLGNVAAALEFPSIRSDGKGNEIPLLASTKVRCILEYFTACSGVRDAEYLKQSLKFIQDGVLHQYSEPSDAFALFSFGTDPKTLRLQRMVPLDQNVTVHAHHEVPKCPSDPDSTSELRISLLAVLNHFNLRPLFGLHEGTLLSFVEYVPEVDTANCTLIALQNYIDKGKLWKLLYPIDVLALIWASVAYSAAPEGKNYTLHFLEQHQLLTDDAIPEQEKEYFNYVVQLVLGAMRPAKLLKTRSDIELTLSDSSRYERKNYHHRMCLMRLLMICAVCSPYTLPQGEPLTILSRRLFACSDEGAGRVANDAELISFQEHVYVHFVRPLLAVLSLFQSPELGKFLHRAEELYQLRVTNKESKR